MRKGIIQSYDKSKRIGTIASPPDRFWFHRDRIVKGPLDPEIESGVLFEILQKPLVAGKLPVATNIVVIEIEAGQIALAEPNGKDCSTEAK